MIKLIEMSGENGKFKNAIWISAEVVVLRGNGAGGSQLKVPNIPGYISVTECPEEVTRKILEYKLAMLRYNAAQVESVKKHSDPHYLSNVDEYNLLEIAGLEE